MYLMPSEVPSVRAVWLSGTAFQPLLSVGNRQRRANAMPPSIPIAPPNLCQLGLSTCQRHPVGIGIQPQVQVFFFFLVHLLSFPRGRAFEWGQSREAPPWAANYYHLSIVSCVSCVSACPCPHPHMRPLGPLARSHQKHMSQAAWTLPIFSIHAPRVSLLPMATGRLIMLVSAHDHHSYPSTTRMPFPPRSPGGPIPPFVFHNGAVPSRGDSTTLWGHCGHRTQIKK